MVLNLNFSQFPEGAQGALDSTTSHEYVHAIQFAYGDPFPFEDNMWYESVAAYMEDEIFDSADSDYQYLWPQVNNCLGGWPDGAAPGEVSEYSNFTFFRHIAEHNGGTNQAGGGEDIAQTLWKNIGAGQSGINAMNSALAVEVVSTMNLPDAFHQYAAALKYSKSCSGGYSAPFCFEEGDAWVSYVGNIVANHHTIATVPGSTNGNVRDNYAMNYVGLPIGSIYDITVENTSAGGTVRASAVCDTGTTLVVEPFPSLAGTGAQTTLSNFDATACNSVTLVLTNQSQTAANPSSCTARSYTVNVTVPVVNTPTPTATTTEPVPTATPTNTPTSTSVPSTATSTNTPTGTTVPATVTPTNTPTRTTVPPTVTPTNTPTSTIVPPTVTATPTPTNTPVSADCDTVSGNLVVNGDFEEGTTPWKFWARTTGTFFTSTPSYNCENAARIEISGSNNNIQLYQRGITLKAGKQYQLSFAAYSSSGNDLSVYIQDHRSPYTNYGLQMEKANLMTGWQQFSVTFVASGFSGTTTDARLRFWLAPFARAGDIYGIDNVQLREVGGSSPTITPTPTNIPGGPTPTPTNTPVSGSCDPITGNIANNGDFETGGTSWRFYTNSSGSFTTQGPAYSCAKAARIQTNGIGSNVQLYQRGIELEANTQSADLCRLLIVWCRFGTLSAQSQCTL